VQAKSGSRPHNAELSARDDTGTLKDSLMVYIPAMAGNLQFMRIVGVLVVIWLVIGALAAGQRGYYSSSAQNCAGVATIGVTIVAGPLNYLGVNPKIKCQLPQPSS
jgi:hypothetical protein